MQTGAQQVAAGLVLLMFATGASAQQPVTQATADAMRAPSLRAAVSLALERNPNRVRTSNDVVAAGFDKKAAEWGRFPTLSVNAGTASSTTRSLTPTSSIQLDQPLWAGGRIEGQIEASSALVTAAEYADADMRRRITEETAAAYIGWVGAAERVEIARTGADSLQRLLSYVTRREQEGLQAPADVSIAGARHASALALTEQLRGELDQARAQLESLIVARINEDRDRPGGIPVAVPEVPDRSLADTEVAYVAQSQLVAQRRAEAESSRAQAKVKRGQLLPTVALRLEQLNYQNSAAFGVSNESRATLMLQFAPGAGFGGYSTYQAAESRVDSALAQLAADENDARLRARGNWSDYRANVRQVAELQPQVAALDSATESFMRQFEAGRKSWLEVLNTQREVLDAKLALSRARTTRDQAAVRLMVNTGTLSTWLETLPQ